LLLLTGVVGAESGTLTSSEPVESENPGDDRNGLREADGEGQLDHDCDDDARCRELLPDERGRFGFWGIAAFPRIS
jgi:hypothetical protein